MTTSEDHLALHEGKPQIEQSTKLADLIMNV